MDCDCWRSWLCCCCGLCCAKKKADQLSAELSKGLDSRTAVWLDSFTDVRHRVLLLGTSDSGKSTLLKHWQFLRERDGSGSSAVYRRPRLQTAAKSSPNGSGKMVSHGTGHTTQTLVSRSYATSMSSLSSANGSAARAERFMQAALEQQINGEIVRGFVMKALKESIEELKKLKNEEEEENDASMLPVSSSMMIRSDVSATSMADTLDSCADRLSRESSLSMELALLISQLYHSRLSAVDSSVLDEDDFLVGPTTTTTTTINTTQSLAAQSTLNKMDSDIIPTTLRTLLSLPHRSRLQYGHTLNHFICRIEQIASVNYVPIPEDLLRVRIRSTGIHELRFEGHSERSLFSVTDVGGSRGERRKWELCYVNSSCVLYCVNLSEFDECCFEDTAQNKLIEALCVWRRLCSDRWMSASPFHLVFTKVDLLRDKILGSNADRIEEQITRLANKSKRMNIELQSGLMDQIRGKSGLELFDSVISFLIRLFLGYLPSDSDVYYGSSGTRIWEISDLSLETIRPAELVSTIVEASMSETDTKSVTEPLASSAVGHPSSPGLLLSGHSMATSDGRTGLSTAHGSPLNAPLFNSGRLRLRVVSGAESSRPEKGSHFLTFNGNGQSNSQGMTRRMGTEMSTDLRDECSFDEDLSEMAATDVALLPNDKQSNHLAHVSSVGTRGNIGKSNNNHNNGGSAKIAPMHAFSVIDESSTTAHASLDGHSLYYTASRGTGEMVESMTPRLIDEPHEYCAAAERTQLVGRHSAQRVTDDDDDDRPDSMALRGGRSGTQSSSSVDRGLPAHSGFMGGSRGSSESSVVMRKREQAVMNDKNVVFHIVDCLNDCDASEVLDHVLLRLKQLAMSGTHSV